jgi:hypothetical protein
MCETKMLMHNRRVLLHHINCTNLSEMLEHGITEGNPKL